MPIGRDRMFIFSPIGTLPSGSHVDARNLNSRPGQKERYAVNSMTIMGRGDILLLFTDGVTDQKFGQFNYFSQRLKDHLRQVKYLLAQEIVESIKADLNQIAGKPDDDAILIVVKKADFQL